MRKMGSISKQLAVAGLTLLLGCSGMKIYDACRKKSQSLDDMDGCMAANGYGVVPVDAAWDPSIGECWDDRYANKIPMEYCYTQGDAPPVDAPYGVIP